MNIPNPGDRAIFEAARKLANDTDPRYKNFKVVVKKKAETVTITVILYGRANWFRRLLSRDQPAEEA